MNKIDWLQYPNFPQSEPRKYKRSLIVKVFVFEVDTNEKIREHKIDFFDDDQAKWFKNMMLWSTMNYKYVKIYNIKDCR